jgi:hypothetical protein
MAPKTVKIAALAPWDNTYLPNFFDFKKLPPLRAGKNLMGLPEKTG